MKLINTMLVASIFCLAGAADAATRVMRGNSIIGGKDVVVAGKIYDVDFGFDPEKGWVTPEFTYPGQASVFLTKEDASEALQAIYTQLIGNGSVNPSFYTLVSIGEYVGSPEQKRFSVAQLYGYTLGPNSVKAVASDFVTEVLFAPGPTMIGTQARMGEIHDFGSTLVPNSRVEGYSFPVWTLKGVTPAVPEPSVVILTALGLLTVLPGAAKRRALLGKNASEAVS